MSDVNTPDIHRAAVPRELIGSRLDQVAARLFPQFSRGRLQAWIRSGALTIDGQAGKARQKLAGGEQLLLIAEPEAQGEWTAEALPLSIVFEDEALLVVNKAAGMVVHPAAGNHSGTLLNALLHHAPQLADLPRGGIVHRLDKDTTGLMVVAKTPQSHHDLVAQLQRRSVGRHYEALALGQLRSGGTVDRPMGRHPQQRKKMAVLKQGGKQAITHYELRERLGFVTYLDLKLETGRTHQIRVHMAHIGHPLLGDATYGGRRQLPRSAPSAVVEAVQALGRQALHARRLELLHPASGQVMSWEVAAPADFQQVLAALRECEPPS